MLFIVNGGNDGTCLGFPPRSESFAYEPSVQVSSISSLSEFRFAEISCFATPASASSIRTEIRRTRCILTLGLKIKNSGFDNFNLTSKKYFYEF